MRTLNVFLGFFVWIAWTFSIGWIFYFIGDDFGCISWIRVGFQILGLVFFALLVGMVFLIITDFVMELVTRRKRQWPQ